MDGGFILHILNYDVEHGQIRGWNWNIYHPIREISNIFKFCLIMFMSLDFSCFLAKERGKAYGRKEGDEYEKCEEENIKPNFF